MALLVGGVLIALVAGIVLAASQGNGFGVLLAASCMTLASTLWLVGVIAFGVRIGMSDN